MGEEEEVGTEGKRLIGSVPHGHWRAMTFIAAPRGHIGLGPGLVDEDQGARINPFLVAFPACAPACDVGSVLLLDQRGFLKG